MGTSGYLIQIGLSLSVVLFLDGKRSRICIGKKRAKLHAGSVRDEFGKSPSKRAALGLNLLVQGGNRSGEDSPFSVLKQFHMCLTSCIPVVKGATRLFLGGNDFHWESWWLSRTEHTTSCRNRVDCHPWCSLARNSNRKNYSHIDCGLMKHGFSSKIELINSPA